MVTKSSRLIRGTKDHYCVPSVLHWTLPACSSIAFTLLYCVPLKFLHITFQPSLKLRSGVFINTFRLKCVFIFHLSHALYSFQTFSIIWQPQIQHVKSTNYLLHNSVQPTIPLFIWVLSNVFLSTLYSLIRSLSIYSQWYWDKPPPPLPLPPLPPQPPLPPPPTWPPPSTSRLSLVSLLTVTRTKQNWYPIFHRMVKLHSKRRLHSPALQLQKMQGYR